jgi:hypothetical protein
MKGNRGSFTYPTDNKGKSSESIESTERTTSRPNENRRDDDSSSTKKQESNYSSEIAETLKKSK